LYKICLEERLKTNRRTISYICVDARFFTRKSTLDFEKITPINIRGVTDLVEGLTKLGTDSAARFHQG
jgi:hypothetical protein